MTSYYVVLQDMDYNNNEVKFISLSKKAAMNFYEEKLAYYKSKFCECYESFDFSIVHYVMSEDKEISQKIILSNYQKYDDSND